MFHRRPDMTRFLYAPPLQRHYKEATDIETWLAGHLPRLGDALGLRLSAAPDPLSESDHLHRLVARDDNDGSLAYIVACHDDFDEAVIFETLTDPVARKARTLIWIAQSFVPDSFVTLQYMNAKGDGENRHFAVGLKGAVLSATNWKPQFDPIVRG